MRGTPACGGKNVASTHVKRRTLVFLIKLVHSAIFLANAGSILEVFVAGVRGCPSSRTRLALTLSLGESALYVASGCRCPLTELVRRASGDDVRVTDIFLPRWLADHIPQIFTPPLVIGVAGLVMSRRRACASRLDWALAGAR